MICLRYGFAGLALAALGVAGCAPAAPAGETATTTRPLRGAARAQPIIFARVHAEAGKLELRGVDVRRGHPSKPARGAAPFALVLRDAQGEELFRVPFSVPRARLPDPPPPHGASRPLPADVWDFALQAPWLPAAHHVALEDQGAPGQALAVAPVPPPPPVPRPDPPLPEIVYDGCSGDPAGCLEILFIAGDYGVADLPAFAATVAAHTSFLLTVEPYASNAGRITVRRLDHTTDLQCSGGFCVWCDDAAVYDAAAAAPYDEIVVLNQGGAGQGCGDITVGGGGPSSYARIMLGGTTESEGAHLTVHELGHSFGGLRDEYIVGWDEPEGPNCDVDGCEAWTGVAGTGCFPGCMRTSFFKSSESCLMEVYTRDAYCPVCRAAVASLLACLGADCSGAAPPGECDTGPAVCDNRTGGACGYAHQSNGTTCGADRCSATCHYGACSTASPVVCPPPAACRQPGQCDPARGCVYEPMADGTACDDGDLCTVGDTCRGGACIGQDVTCPAAGPCLRAGWCDRATGLCGYSTPADDGTPCDSPCATGGHCRDGACHGGTPRSCDDHNPCTYDTCGDDGGCRHTRLTGTVCATGGACHDGVCQDGTCVAADAGCGPDGGPDGGADGDGARGGGGACACAAAAPGAGGAPWLVMALGAAWRRGPRARRGRPGYARSPRRGDRAPTSAPPPARG